MTKPPPYQRLIVKKYGIRRGPVQNALWRVLDMISWLLYWRRTCFIQPADQVVNRRFARFADRSGVPTVDPVARLYARWMSYHQPSSTVTYSPISGSPRVDLGLAPSDYDLYRSRKRGWLRRLLWTLRRY